MKALPARLRPHRMTKVRKYLLADTTTSPKLTRVKFAPTKYGAETQSKLDYVEGLYSDYCRYILDNMYFSYTN